MWIKLIRKQVVFAILLINVTLFGCQSTDVSTKTSKEMPKESVRKTHIIADNWRFQIDVRDVGEKESWFEGDFSNWSEVAVPQAWNCFDEGLWQYQGIGWYSTTIGPDDFISGRKNEILFGRVMQVSKIWLNGEFVGEHVGGYLPFSFDISRYLKPDQDNILVVRVDNRASIERLPAAEQIEWIQYGGIIEPVKVISKSPVYIDDLIVRTKSIDNGPRIACVITVANETDRVFDGDVHLEISGDNTLAQRTLKVRCEPGEKTRLELDLDLGDAKLWSPGTPVLYAAKALLSNGEDQTDDLSDRFGIRTISTRGTSILLNGNPILIQGSHRYDPYDRYGPNPPEDLIRQDLSLMKRVGINTVRSHYPVSPTVLNILDEFGLLMMEEIPFNWWGLKWEGMKPIGGTAKQSLEILGQAKSTLSEMISRDKNHPSIIIWSMANESRTNTEVGIEVMRELLRLAKAVDPSRLRTFVVGGNPIGHLAFEEADIVSFNDYFICDHISQIDSAVYGQLSKKLARYRDNFPGKPIIMSEFGRQAVKGMHGDTFYTEEWQAAYIESNWRAIKENSTIAGGILWTWADYFHELHFALNSSYEFYGVTPASYGAFGVVTGDRRHKKSLETLARMFGGSIP